MGIPPQITLLFRPSMNVSGECRQEVTIGMDDAMQKAFAKVLVFQTPMSVSVGDGGWESKDWVFFREHGGDQEILSDEKTPREIGLKDRDVLKYANRRRFDM